MNILFKSEKRKRNLIILITVALGSCVVWLATGGSVDKAKVEKVVAPKIEVINKEQSVEEGFKLKFTEELTGIKREQDDIRKAAEDLRLENERLKSELKITNEVLLSDLPKSANGERQLGNGGMSFPQTPNMQTDNYYNYNKDMPLAPPQAVVISNLIAVGQPLSVIEKPKVATVSKNSGLDLIIPAGSFMKAELLSGVTAPTMGKATSDPVPALLRVIGLVNLPNFYKADIKECFLLAESKGSLATEMVSFRLKDLSCKTSDGKTIERAVDGYVAGENGMEGLTGRVVSKQATMLGRTFIAEFLGGLSEALSSGSESVTLTGDGVITTVDPNKALENSAFSGAAGAATRLSEFYMDLVDEMVPVIEVNAGRLVDVIVTKSINLSDSE